MEGKLYYASTHDPDKVKIVTGSELLEFVKRKNNDLYLDASDTINPQDFYIADFGAIDGTKLVSVNLGLQPKKLGAVDTKGIVFDFPSLKTHREIELFAKKYGLLGVSIPFDGIVLPKYELNNWESLEVWESYIEHFSYLLKIYQFLKKKNSGENIDLIGEIIEYDEDEDFLPFSWVNGDRIYFPFTNKQKKELELTEYKDFDVRLGLTLLSFYIQSGIQHSINLKFSDIIPAKNSIIGVRAISAYETDYLLASIYFDFWRLMNDKEEINFCEHCGKPFEKFGRRKYCSDSCRSLAYQRRKQNK